MEDLERTTEPLRNFPNYVGGKTFSLLISLASFMVFCKTIPQIYVEKNDPQ